METIGYGFLIGIGILLACLAFTAVCGLVFLASLFVSYMRERRKRPSRPRDVKP
jgi:UPF0716 family protein affecting phage T7 exclusion